MTLRLALLFALLVPLGACEAYTAPSALELAELAAAPSYAPGYALELAPLAAVLELEHAQAVPLELVPTAATLELAPTAAAPTPTSRAIAFVLELERTGPPLERAPLARFAYLTDHGGRYAGAWPTNGGL